VPRFLVQGDTTEVVGKTLNYTIDTLSVTTIFEVNNQVVKTRQAQVITANIDSIRVTTSAADSTQIKYYVRKPDGYFDGEMRSIPVYKKGVEETKGQFVSLNRDTTFTIRFDPTLGKVKVYAQADVLNILLEEIEHVYGYEYLCNEQAASKLKVLLLEKKIRTYLGQRFTHEADVKKLISKLEAAQRKEGGWGWWPESNVSPWISSHVAEALIQSREAGYPVRFNSQAIIDYNLYHLETFNRSEKIQALRLLKRLDAKVNYASYIPYLTEVTKPSLYEQMQWIELKQLNGLAYSTDTLLRTKHYTQFGGLYWGQESYNLVYSDITLTLTAYQILKRKGGHEAELAAIRQFLLEKRRGGFWRNTYESALILETILPDLLNGEKMVRPARLTLQGKANTVVDKFPYEQELPPDEVLEVRKTGNLPVFLTAYQQFWNPNPEKAEKDFVVSTSFEGKKSDRVSLEAGKPVALVVHVQVKKESEYVMIEVPIPAGCSYGEKGGWQPNEAHREYSRHKTSIFCNQLRQGNYQFTIHLLPRYKGIYTINPAKAELMYFPVFFGRNETKVVNVK
jgi:uncharacterized protein YfaS (alpha-2-macroglobulin family)